MSGAQIVLDELCKKSLRSVQMPDSKYMNNYSEIIL